MNTFENLKPSFTAENGGDVDIKPAGIIKLAPCIRGLQTTLSSTIGTKGRKFLKNVIWAGARSPLLSLLLLSLLILLQGHKRDIFLVSEYP